MSGSLPIVPSDDPIEVPLAILDQALELPLRSEHIGKLVPDLALCERLYFALRDYHRHNRIQPIDRRRLRPNLSFVGLGRGVQVNTDFDVYKTGSYIPRNGEFTVPTQDVKAALLFSDAVVIEDPVFAFCRAVLCHRFQETRPAWDVLRRALSDLAAMRELVEMRLVRLVAYFPEPIERVASRIPRTAGTISVMDVMAATDFNDAAVLALLAGEPAAELADGAPGPKRQLVHQLRERHGHEFHDLYRQAESVVYARVDADAYAPFLGSQYQYDLFAKLCRINAREEPSERLWKLSELNSGCVPDADKVGFDELAQIRLNDEVLETWRSMVEDASKSATDGDAFDPIEFRKKMDDHQARWNDKLRRYKGRRLMDIVTLGKQISVGAIGGLAKAVKSGSASFDALANVVLGPVKGTHDELLRRKAELAMAASFMAVRPIAPRSPNEW